MSLRLRLVFLTLALVIVAALALSALQVQTSVDSLLQDTITRATIAGDQVSGFVIDRISMHLSEPEYATPVSIEETPARWRQIVAADPEIPQFIKRTITKPYFLSILQINVLSNAGEVLAFYPEAIGATEREPFYTWMKRPWYKRAYDLVTSNSDWEVSAPPIGLEGDAAEIIRVQVLVSSTLLRHEPINLLKRLAKFSSAVILVALALALLATHSALRPLHRIERTIDRITQGNFQAGEAESPLAKEFQAVESKLNLLGQRIQMTSPLGEKKLDVLMERVATQLAVAQRLSAISRLSGGVAHEIKNPLNAISLRLDLLKVRLGDTDEDLTGELNILSKEVLRLNRVVTTFLDFSRPVEVHFEEVDLAALTREVAELIRPQAMLSDIEVECVTPDEPGLMSGDPDLLKQAILNLVTNAVEAMGSAGGRLQMEVARSESNWVLTVTDSGPGIPPELRDKVFQLYFTSKTKGSGIGLAMTYRAAQLHNGTIDFASESGVGTTFRLEFPATVTHA